MDNRVLDYSSELAVLVSNSMGAQRAIIEFLGSHPIPFTEQQLVEFDRLVEAAAAAHKAWTERCHLAEGNLNAGS